MNKFLSYSYNDLEETMNHLNIIKLKRYLEDNVTYFCVEILLDSGYLDSARVFNPEYLGYITRIFEDNYNCRFFFSLFISTSR